MKTSLIYLTLILSLYPVVSRAEINLKTARQLSAEAISQAESKKKCISVAVVDDAANLLYFERSLCAPLGSIETSIQKAKSSALFRKPTSDFVAAVKAGKIGILSVKGLLAVEGGLPILIKDAFAGAIGIGGATSLEDEEFGQSALKKLEKSLKE